jgi:GAF domain-containing protein/HAMP domain-containing protein
MIGTLVLFTFIPLIFMAGAAFLRARALLREQAVTQMQSLVTGQTGQVQNEMKVKHVRLDRIVRRSDVSSAMQVILHQSPTSVFFLESQQQIMGAFEELNSEVDVPVFNQFFVFDPDGIILAASQQKWEGVDIHDSPLFQVLIEADTQSVGVYDFAPLYPGEFILLTVEQYRTSDGVARATMVGVSEPQVAASILQSLIDVTPPSRAYFVTDYGGFIKLNSYTREPNPFSVFAEQRDAIVTALEPTKTGSIPIAPTTVEFTNERGEPVLSQVVWLNELKMGIVLEVPIASIEGKINSLIPFTIGVFILSMIATISVIGLATNQVVKPILSLASITSRFAEGDLQGRAEVRGNNELTLLSASFNRMADQLSKLYTSLQERVEERTRQIRTAAEVAQVLTTAFNLDDLLKSTATLIVERFGYYHAGIFLMEEGGHSASLRSAYGPSAEEMLKRGIRHEVGSGSIVGWVTANQKPRIASDVEKDPIHWRNELLPNTRAEVGIPISHGGVVIGVLDVQSTESETFDEETIIVLQTLANQIATAIQNAIALDAAKLSMPEIDRVFRTSFEISEAVTEAGVLQAGGQVLKESTHPFMILKVNEDDCEMAAWNHPARETRNNPPTKINIDTKAFDRQLSGPMLVNDLSKTSNAPQSLSRLLLDFGCQNGAFLPIRKQGRLFAILLLGEQAGQPLTSASVRPYTIIADMMASELEKVAAINDSRARVSQLEALSAFNQTIFATTDISAFYATLQEQILRVIGECSFVIALYDQNTNSINIPYTYEDGKINSIEPFPLGEGLTSILIRTKKPLLLVEDTERQAQALGAKIHGKPAQSWMGAPLLVGDEAIGALIAQDAEHEHRFNEHDLAFLVEAARQMAGVVHNVRLLNQSRRNALQLQTAAEIARDISGSLTLDELLLRAVNLIRERFEFYHASVFLLDNHGEFAVIREATGEAGAQLKRMGHKLRVGSKSIVGYVTGQGEPLVVNDAQKDATYYANPVLPDTRAEAAIPLKVGERILGALDVQSIHPYDFSEENLRTLEILADQLAVAVVNTELFAETQEHLSQHRLLHHITTSAASGSTLEEALETTVKGLQVTLGGDRVAILLMDRERKTLETRAAIGYSEDVLSVRVPIGSGMTGWVAMQRKSLRVDDVTNDPRYIQVSSNTRSEMVIPLIYRNELLGVLNVESERVAGYTENDEEMLGTLAGSLAAVIANARLLEQIRRQAERERQLYEITSKIRRTTDIPTILATTASEISRATGARRAQIKIDLGAAQEGGNGAQEERRR